MARKKAKPTRAPIDEVMEGITNTFNHFVLSLVFNDGDEEVASMEDVKAGMDAAIESLREWLEPMLKEVPGGKA